MDGLVSFLQEALPYYALPEYLSTPRIEESYHETARLVYMVFVRLGSSNEYVSTIPLTRYHSQSLFVKDILFSLLSSHKVLSCDTNTNFSLNIKQPLFARSQLTCQRTSKVCSFATITFSQFLS